MEKNQTTEDSGFHSPPSEPRRISWELYSLLIGIGSTLAATLLDLVNKPIARLLGLTGLVILVISTYAFLRPRRFPGWLSRAIDWLSGHTPAPRRVIIEMIRVITAVTTVGVLAVLPWMPWNRSDCVEPAAAPMTPQAALVQLSSILLPLHQANASQVVESPLGDQVEVAWCFQAEKPSTTPLILQDMIYFGSGSRLYAVHGLAQQDQWYLPAQGQVSAPAVRDDTIYVGSEDGHMYVIDARSAITLTLETQDWGEAPFPPVATDDWLYFVSTHPVDGGYLYAWVNNAGRYPWFLAKFITGDPVGPPAAVDDVAVVRNTTGVLYAVVAGSEPAWTFDLNSTIGSAPIAIGDSIYLTGGRSDGAAGSLYEFDALTGDVSTRPLEFVPTSSFAVNQDVVLIGDLGGALHALKRGSGEELWRFSTDDLPIVSPVIHDSIVYLAIGRTLLAIDLSTGEQLWSYDLSDEITYPPTVTDDAVYIGDSGGRLTVLRAP